MKKDGLKLKLYESKQNCEKCRLVKVYLNW